MQGHFATIRNRAARYWLMVLAFAVLLSSPVFAEPPAIASPAGGKLILAKPDQTVVGRAWLADCGAKDKTYHMEAESSVVFDLSGMKLKPGVYRIGLLARTGTHWTNATGQTASYRLSIERDNIRRELGGVHGLADPVYAPVKTAGEQNSWANWYAFVAADHSARLSGSEKLIIHNQSGQGGVMGVWLKPMSGPQVEVFEMSTGVALNAFIRGQTPQVKIVMKLADDAAAWQGNLNVVAYDLITAMTRKEQVRVVLEPGKEQTLVHQLPASAGIYQITAALGGSSEDAPTVTQLLAYTPCKLARDLPDDWPIAFHVDADLPALPGARWYRFFAMWPNINTAPGVYHWQKFDKVFREVQQIGGKLMFASDGSPVWTSSRGKVGMDWNNEATAYPPDDNQTLVKFLDLMIARYEDEAGTLAALETCNEANTPDRWRGTPEQLVQQSRIFKTAAGKAKHPIKVVGISASAGEQRPYIESLINAGVLKEVDAVSSHFYEEMMSYERNTPINNLPQHVEGLREPMENAGFHLPMLNTESGLEFARRQGVVLVDQEALNKRAESDPSFNPSEPWIVQNHWRPVSERRAAATFVNSTVMLLAMGFKQTYCFTQIDFIYDGVPSLPWVALGQLGFYLDGVDYHHIQPLTAYVQGSDGKDGSPLALAYLLGKPGGKQIIVAWAFLSDTKFGRSKHWQKWLNPVPVEITTGLASGTMHDLYGRTETPVTNHAGKLVVQCGEEPVFISNDH